MNIPAEKLALPPLLTFDVNSEQIASQGKMGTMGHSLPCMEATRTL